MKNLALKITEGLAFREHDHRYYAKELLSLQNNAKLARERLKTETNPDVKGIISLTIKRFAALITQYRAELKRDVTKYNFEFTVTLKHQRISVCLERRSRVLTSEFRTNLLLDLKDAISRKRKEARESTRLVYLLDNLRELKQGKVWTRSGIYLRAYKQKLATKIFKDKKPIGKKNHIGIEIEFYVTDGTGRKDLAKLFADANLTDNVTLKDDASIRCESDHDSFEVAVISREDQVEDIVDRTCSILNEVNAEVNASCGLHIHIDARNRNPELIFRRLLNAQKYLMQLVPASRRNNTYCRPLSVKQSFDQVEGRYHAINPAAYKKYKTIEIRLHSGTTNSTKINNWIRLLLSIVNHGVVKGNPKLGKWLKAIGCCKTLQKFYIDRAKSFASPNQSEPEHCDLPPDEDDENDSCGECGSDNGACSDCNRCHQCGCAA